MKPIDKDKIVAEIEKRRDESWLGMYTKEKGIIFDITDEILSFINTLEVKEVENTELLKVRGYLVRDKDDYTAIYAEKPHRGKTEWVKGNDSCLMTINDARLVPDIEFEDEPVEVEVTLKRVQIK